MGKAANPDALFQQVIPVFESVRSVDSSLGFLLVGMKAYGGDASEIVHLLLILLAFDNPQLKLHLEPVDVVEGVELFSHLANIGDTRSLILHPASTTHRQLTEEQRITAGPGSDVVRLSVGLETLGDLIRDLDQALEAA